MYNKTKIGGVESYLEKHSMLFVLRKFMSFAPLYYISLFEIAALKVSYGNGKNIFLHIIPELFGIHKAIGFSFVNYHVVTWYMSSMLFAMLLLFYILLKNDKFFLYIFCPLVSIFIFSYMMSSEKPFNAVDNRFICIFRALCGICFGGVSYTIYLKLSEVVKSKRQRVVLTVAEILLYTVILSSLIRYGKDTSLMFPMMLLMPIAIAITFSGQSYLSNLFRSRIFKYCGSASLYITFNHLVILQFIQYYMPFIIPKGYGYSVLIMLILTIILSIINFLIIKLGKLLIAKYKSSHQS